MNKAIFLDRDGTINVDYGYVYKKEDLTFIDGTFEALSLLKKLGFLLIIISNQSAIGRGYCKKEDVDQFFDYMLEELKKHNILIDGVYYCPHYNEECDCRKPKIGLFYKAQKEHNIDFNLSYAIGDKERDVTICDKENVFGIILNDVKDIKNKVYKKNLLEAAKFIQSRCKNEEN